MMMKVILKSLVFVSLMILIGTADVNGFRINNQFENIQDSKRTEITLDNVPDIVWKALEDSDYNETSVSAMYRVTEGEELYYEFVLPIDGKNWSVFYDSAGKFMQKEETER